MKIRDLKVILLGLLLTVNNSANAITDGTEDEGDKYPEVVLVVGDIEEVPAFRCSGVLLSPTAVLTAGHCTYDDPLNDDDDITGMRVFSESDVQNGINNYPDPGGDNTVEAESWTTHPDFDPVSFFLHDVGIIKLIDPIILDEYAVLPDPDELDILATRRGLQNTIFTTVGYGYQKINPVFLEAERKRMIASPHLIRMGDFSLLLTNNHSTGGTCFADSGGPNYLPKGNLKKRVLAITSFSKNNNCAGTGGVFRLDRQDVLDFINDKLAE